MIITNLRLFEHKTYSYAQLNEPFEDTVKRLTKDYNKFNQWLTSIGSDKFYYRDSYTVLSPVYIKIYLN